MITTLFAADRAPERSRSVSADTNDASTQTFDSGISSSPNSEQKFVLFVYYVKLVKEKRINCEVCLHCAVGTLCKYSVFKEQNCQLLYVRGVKTDLV